jgi:hypothetical protein
VVNRREYLTGFKKRKDERREKAQKEIKNEDRSKKREQRKERKQVSNLIQAKEEMVINYESIKKANTEMWAFEQELASRKD